MVELLGNKFAAINQFEFKTQKYFLNSQACDKSKICNSNFLAPHDHHEEHDKVNFSSILTTTTSTILPVENDANYEMM